MYPRDIPDTGSEGRLFSCRIGPREGLRYHRRMEPLVDPSDRWLISNLYRADPDCRQRFARDVETVMLEAGSSPAEAAVMASLLRHRDETPEALAELDLLTQGQGWQRARVELPHFYAVATGIAMSLKKFQSVKMLAERGALVSWPADAGTDWSGLTSFRKSEQGKTVHKGDSPIPLLEAACVGPYQKESLGWFFKAVEAMDAHGADPLEQDPISGARPLDLLLSALGGFSWDGGDDPVECAGWFALVCRWCRKDQELMGKIRDRSPIPNEFQVLEEMGVPDFLRAQVKNECLEDNLPTVPSRQRVRM